MTTDTIADMLTRIRNANLAKHQVVQIPSTKITKFTKKSHENINKSFDYMQNTKKSPTVGTDRSPARTIYELRIT